MLVLTRHAEESITLPGLNVVFKILEFRTGNAVRIGIEAPDGVLILRTELIDNPQIELGVDRTLDCGSLGQINPNGLVNAIRAASVDDDCDAEPLPRFMTPMQKVDYYSRGIDKRKNHHHED